LIFSNFDIINANDLDTILPAILVAKLRGKKVVYDAHEYFSEQEEVVARPRIKWIWKAIEKWSIPSVDAAYTVSDGYANLFFSEYEVPFLVVKNATVLKEFHSPSPSQKYILYQGAVNHGRGLPELIEAMKKVDGMLYICGDGDILEDLKLQVKSQNLEEKVKFWGFIAPEKLTDFTQNASIGLTLFAKGGLSHWYSLANRFFDYMHAGIPQLAMDYPEYSTFNKKHEIAVLINDIHPDTIAEGLRKLLSDDQLYARLSKNALIAREQENWQAQESVLLSVYRTL
jgi:glycosyltransferase involved in cell wall biosynthesis